MPVDSFSPHQFDTNIPQKEFHQPADVKNNCTLCYEHKDQSNFSKKPCKESCENTKLEVEDKKESGEEKKEEIYTVKIGQNRRKEYGTQSLTFQLHSPVHDYNTDEQLLAEHKEFIDKITVNKDLESIKTKIDILRKNSLFSNRSDLSHEDRADIISVANNVPEALKKYPKRFEDSPPGITCPTIDKKYNVIFKRDKSFNIDIYSKLIRKIIEEKELDNIIVPTREIWIEQLDDKGSSKPVFIENLEEGVLGVIKAQYLYKSNPELFDKPIEEIVELFLVVEVGDTCLGDSEYAKFLSRFDNKPYIRAKFADKCRCSFGNLAVKQIVDEDGNKSIKFTLVDLDLVRKPDISTVHNLFRMFPYHKELIYSVIQRIKPELISEIDESMPGRDDVVSWGIVYNME